MKIMWIGGWGISTESLKMLVNKAFPTFDHLCIHPQESFLTLITDYKPDVVVGYSIGATLLMVEPSSCIQEYLIAPFLNLKDAVHIEYGQLKYLLKWLRKDPINAINDFYKRAHLSIPAITTLPYSIDDLVWGIEMIIKKGVITINNNKHILVGDLDPLIKSNYFLHNFPHSKLYSDVDHNIENYFKFLPF